MSYSMRAQELAQPDDDAAVLAGTSPNLERSRPIDAASQLAAEIKARLAAGDGAQARELFGDLVGLHQRRANRIAVAYLRNPADADEAVQDAFVRVFGNMTAYREDLPFEQWFTRILVNGCIDRHRARERRDRRLVPLEGTDVPASAAPSPERHVAARQWASAVSEAVQTLPDRQRAVFTLCHYAERTPAEASEILGVRESTVRVHLFRAMRRLRVALEGWRDAR
jgi:RNA polymerase sigma-70 factor (ECF subfamily)